MVQVPWEDRVALADSLGGGYAVAASSLSGLPARSPELLPPYVVQEEGEVLEVRKRGALLCRVLVGVQLCDQGR
jgi:hypothetical protein